MHASNRPVSEDEEENDVRTPVVTSWAGAGQQVVFLYMYASGTGHADDVLHSDP